MTVLDTLNFVAFNPLQNNNPIAVRRRKLMAKIDEQMQQIREELKDKPDELRRYANKLHQATFNDNCPSSEFKTPLVPKL